MPFCRPTNQYTLNSIAMKRFADLGAVAVLYVFKYVYKGVGIYKYALFEDPPIEIPIPVIGAGREFPLEALQSETGCSNVTWSIAWQDGHPMDFYNSFWIWIPAVVLIPVLLFLTIA